MNNLAKHLLIKMADDKDKSNKKRNFFKSPTGIGTLIGGAWGGISGLDYNRRSHALQHGVDKLKRIDPYAEQDFLRAVREQKGRGMEGLVRNGLTRGLKGDIVRVAPTIAATALMGAGIGKVVSMIKDRKRNSQK